MIKMDEDEARAVLFLSRKNPVEFATLINYFTRNHEDSRDKLEDADTNDERLRAQGVSREFRSLKEIGSHAEVHIRAIEVKRKNDNFVKNDTSDTSGMV